MRDFCVTVDVRFHVKAANEDEAWEILKRKSEQVQDHLLKFDTVVDDIVAADVWEFTA